MTKRERVYDLTRKGLTVKEISAKIGLSDGMVRKYRREMDLNQEEKVTLMPPGFWEEWDRTVALLLGRKIKKS